MNAKIEFTPEQQAEIKRLYERTLTPPRDIAARMGVSRPTLRRRIHGWGLRPRKVASRPIELLHAVRGAVLADVSAGTVAAPPLSNAALAQQRAAITVRILRAVELELDAVQRVLAVLDPSEKDEAERTTRALADISRTLREAAALNRSDDMARRDDPDDDPVPDDIDQFRRELARRLRGIVDAERGPGRESVARGVEEDPAALD